MAIYELLADGAFVIAEPSDKETAIREMVEAAYEAGFVDDKFELERSVLERESIVSTGIGLGIAVPHTRTKFVAKFFIVAAVFKQPVEWDSIDKKPVHAAFMIVGPEEEQKRYLEMLAKLVLLVKNSARREQLFKAQTKEELLKLFERF